jgi:carbamoyltransferase
MIVLGIHDGHNATAALMVDGRIAHMVSEERLTYRKNEMGFPQLAVNCCLEEAGIDPARIDQVAFSTRSLPLPYMRIKREFAFTVRDWLDEQERHWKPLLETGTPNLDYYPSLLRQDRFNEPQVYNFTGVPEHPTPAENAAHLKRIREEALARLYGIAPEKVTAHRHHVCHQYYAYFGSPFRGEDCLVVTCDGGGDGGNGSLAVARGDLIEEIATNNHTDLGRIYRYITLLLGMKIGEHEYKVMGLAPYASDYEIARAEKAFRGLFHVPELMVEYAQRPRDLFFSFRDQLADCRFDGIAGAVQRMVEEVGTAWFSRATERLGLGRVVFSGGVSMNVKLNKLVGELPSVKEFYCAASGGDESLALGACYVSQSSEPDVPMQSIEDNYLGPAVSRSTILEAVGRLEGVTVREGVTAEEVAGLLERNLILGRFVGRMEFGARSLGNRSIIANPADPETVRRINRKIKFRDFWMPFAPSILEEYAPRYLVNPKGLHSDHMTIAFDTTPEGRRDLVAAVHPADFTVRAHIVRRDLNPGYHALISAFSRRTGVGGLLNTSFNLHGYPIVCQPAHAVHVFENSELDAMLLEDVLVVRQGLV